MGRTATVNTMTSSSDVNKPGIYDLNERSNVKL